MADAVHADSHVPCSLATPAAVSAAQGVVSAIEQCDDEVASLTRDANPTEMDRLETQLATLDGAQHGENADRHELRALVVHQLELLRRMSTRAESLAHRRAHLFHLLRGLWAQLCLTRTTSPSGMHPEGHAVDNLRALCAEIDGEIGGRGATAVTPSAPLR